MFRIDRNLVKLGDVRAVQTVQVDKDKNDGNDGVELNESIEAGVAGGSPDAEASATTMAHVILSTAEAESKAKAHELIKEAEAKATAGAEKIIVDARQAAETVIRSAREQAEQERSRARKEGYDEGVQEGKRSYDERLEEKMHELKDEYEKKTREVEDAYDEKIREDDDKLKRVIEELYDERTRTYDELEEQVVGLALDIVRKVINPSAEELGGVFEMLIKNALKQINPDGKVIIRVGPAEYERFFSSGSAFFELDKGVTVTASVLRDLSLEEGDCIIDMEGETINAGLDSQLKYIKFAFDRIDRV